jgi:hypothetical protein
VNAVEFEALVDAGLDVTIPPIAAAVHAKDLHPVIESDVRRWEGKGHRGGAKDRSHPHFVRLEVVEHDRAVQPSVGINRGNNDTLL